MLGLPRVCKCVVFRNVCAWVSSLSTLDFVLCQFLMICISVFIGFSIGLHFSSSLTPSDSRGCLTISGMFAIYNTSSSLSVSLVQCCFWSAPYDAYLVVCSQYMFLWCSWLVARSRGTVLLLSMEMHISSNNCTDCVYKLQLASCIVFCTIAI